MTLGLGSKARAKKLDKHKMTRQSFDHQELLSGLTVWEAQIDSGFKNRFVAPQLLARVTHEHHSASQNVAEDHSASQNVTEDHKGSQNWSFSSVLWEEHLDGDLCELRLRGRVDDRVVEVPESVGVHLVGDVLQLFVATREVVAVFPFLVILRLEKKPGALSFRGV